MKNRIPIPPSGAVSGIQTTADRRTIILLIFIMIVTACAAGDSVLFRPGGLTQEQYQQILKNPPAGGNAGTAGVYPENSPVALHGKLKVVGNRLCDEKGTPVVLHGVFLRALMKENKFINKEAFAWMAKEWKIDVIRIPFMSESWYSEPSYIGKPEYEAYVDRAVELCEQNGIYCIIDWHVLGDGNPFKHAAQSRDFFQRMAYKYGAKKHVIYELCNEPNGAGVTWKDVIKPYAEFIIPVIRSADPDSIIIVGPSTWSQDVDIAADDPLSYKNIVYAFHFYSGTHKQRLRDRVKKASKKIALFSTEWGNSDCYARGGPYIEESKKWLELMRSEKISWCHYALTDFDEGAAMLRPGVKPTGGWGKNDLTASGAFVLEYLRNSR